MMLMKYARLSGEVKSPLRYPGGKSRAIPQIVPLIPPFKEYREPFVGGGSVFVAVKQRAASDATFKINDLNQDLYCLWKSLRDEPKRLIDAIKETKARYVEGAELNRDMRDWQCNDDFERAVRFFIINRTSFSGLSDSGGFSQQAFRSRFTDSSIARLVKMKPIMKDVIITNDDYHVLLEDVGDDVFIFLDPPYFKAMKKRLYGKDGDLHVGFDHERFARAHLAQPVEPPGDRLGRTEWSGIADRPCKQPASRQGRQISIRKRHGATRLLDSPDHDRQKRRIGTRAK